jgi:hypothetical protein
MNGKIEAEVTVRPMVRFLNDVTGGQIPIELRQYCSLSLSSRRLQTSQRGKTEWQRVNVRTGSSITHFTEG